MFKQGGILNLVKIFLILMLIAAGFFYAYNAWSAEKININTASLEELDSLPGIGPARAQAIIDYRNLHLFTKIEDIMNVTGIKQATFDEIKDLITVGGEITAPACGDGKLDSGEECDDGNLVNNDGCSLNCKIETSAATSTPPVMPLQAEAATTTDKIIKQINFGDVVINELVSDPTDNEEEFIELYNKTEKEIDLSGWRLEDGSKAKTNLAGLIGLNNLRYKVIEKPAGQLNNAGDIIILYDPSGRIIDQVVYGNWADGNLEDNAPAASDPASLARKYDGYNTYNNANDFLTTLKPTKGSSNIIQAEDEVSQEAKANFDFSSDIYLSEILPNPAGDDATGEFMEIYNAGQREVNLTGWSLSNQSGKKAYLEKIVTSTLIQAGEYLALYRPKTKIVLSNDQGEVKLFQPLAKQPIQLVKYDKVKEGWSYNKANPPAGGVNWSSSEWTWSETITPGQINIIKAVNHAPEVEFSFPKEIIVKRPVMFDSSDTDDLDGDSLKYAWDFGDGFKNSLASPEHTYLKAGIYSVKLEVDDGQAVGKKEKQVKVIASSTSSLELNLADENAETPLAPLLKGGGVIINEILPNPAGADTGQEWAELKNQSAGRINLISWRLENENGRYKFKNDLWLEPESFYLLTNQESKLAFKKRADAISLYNDLDELIDRVEYSAAVLGEAYARGENGRWFWTTALSPGEENIISLANSQNVNNNKIALVGAGELIIETTLEKVRELEIGSLIKVKGIVAVEPGILGVQIFYIVGSPGLQIYNYKKDFPALKVGDLIEVSGELSQAQNELRLKTKDKNDISVKEHSKPPLALALSCDQVSEENIGQLITISGEITDKKSYTLYLDDGQDEILVYFKKATGISTKNFAAGQSVAVTGILSNTQTGLRLMPRYQADIVKINQANELGPQVLGEVAEAKEWAVAERDKKMELFKYLLIILSVVIIILIVLFFRIKKSKH